jgi:hypothetical protein
MRISKALLFAVVAVSAGADAKLFGKDKREYRTFVPPFPPGDPIIHKPAPFPTF